MVVDLPGPEATDEFGRRLGALLFPGAVVALVGQLGAGKTHLCRAIATGVGVPDGRVVTSPTFVLVQEYDGGRLSVYHFDAYRLHDEAEFADLGAAEYFEGQGVALVEWADRVPGCLPDDRLWLELRVTGPSSREARLTATGPRHATVLGGLDGSLRG
jgi:tRNA threonylcarbamoyladenosine biosynthesis protein TsaE